LLGTGKEHWKQLDSYAKLGEWMNAGQGLLAPVLAAIDLKESKLDFIDQPATCALMPTWAAPEVLKMFGSHPAPEFAALPQHDEKPMETGMLAHNQHTPLLQDVLHKRPARLLARVIARLADLLNSAEALVRENISGRAQGISASGGSGWSVVRTARGTLLHYVNIQAEQIVDYLTIAPTEWNFHPNGPLTSGLTGLKESDVVSLMETVKFFVLSLDPCVEYEIEVIHA